MRSAQAAAVIALALAYFSYVFQVRQPSFVQAGIGDWGDPYFINFVLEHWYVSFTRFANPASPPMFFPATGTLGYSHGLILFAPVYAGLRSMLEPLQAHSVTILLVLLAGSVSLYLILRHFIRLSFVESVLLTAFFSTSRNVINPGTSIWSQTASVFLIPPILLLTLVAARTRPGMPRNVLAGVSGLLATLLFTQEFYTAHYALFFVSVISLVLLGRTQPSFGAQVREFWNHEGRIGVRIAAIATVLAGAWTLSVMMFGGGVIEIGGLRVASRDWRRPALLCVASIAVVMYRRGLPGVRVDLTAGKGWIPPFIVGAGAGVCLFVWIYLKAYLEHPGFSQEELAGMLRAYDAGPWYESFRPFWFAFLAGGVACVPIRWVRADTMARRYCAGFLLLSVLVLLAPVRFDTFSAWSTFIAPLPGFSAIRDPRRIIHVYELLVVLLTAVFLTRLSPKAPLRLFVPAALVLCIAADWNREVFVFARSHADFQRWVEAPIAIDPSCQSFVMKPGSVTYSSRWDNKYILYGVDASFVALRHALPTLNGYSAWVPPGWHFTNPEAANYTDDVDKWIRQERIAGVCELDIDARRMTPYVSASR